MELKYKKLACLLPTLFIVACSGSGSGGGGVNPAVGQNFDKLLQVGASGCTDSGCQPGVYFVSNDIDAKTKAAKRAASMPKPTIGAEALTKIGDDLQAQQQSSDQWSNNHYAILVAPGTYNMPHSFELGYYTQVLGVGDSMDDTILNPGVEAHNQGGFVKGAPGCINADGSWTTNPLCKTIGGLNNFWRGVENFTMDFSKASNVLVFAVSQASPIRSIHFQGGSNNVLLCDFHTPIVDGNAPCGFTSGGFMANSKIDTALIPGSQQQWLTRNSSFGSAELAIWNSVFVGNNKPPVAPPSPYPFWYNQATDNQWNNFPVSNITATPSVEEKPYLTCGTTCTNSDIDTIQWKVMVPSLRTAAIGVDTTTPTALDLKTQFYLINPDIATTVNGVTMLTQGNIDVINTMLKDGKNLLIMPGTYNLGGGSINITNNNTVVLGIGLPSLVCANGSPCITVANTANQGVHLAGFVFDAGYKLTPSLLQIGSTANNPGSATNPIVLNDVYFRIAETQETVAEAKANPSLIRQTTAAAIINTSNVIGDNLWIWRADHDKSSVTNPNTETAQSMTDATQNLVNWQHDLAQYGLVVYGDNVTMYGLAVEHFQNYQTVWYGNNGSVYFYQSEMPYDVPTIGQWTCSQPNSPTTITGTGCASYVVNAASHYAIGVGIYTYFASTPIMAPSAMIVPQSANITIDHIIGKWLNGDHSSGYQHLITNSSGNWGCGVKFDSNTIESHTAEEYSVLGKFDNTAANGSACVPTN